MDIEFKSARELYMKVIPALNTKRRILNKKGIKISDKEKLRLTKVFLEFNESFEDLMQRNIIKDAYIWK